VDGEREGAEPVVPGTLAPESRTGRVPTRRRQSRSCDGNRVGRPVAD